MTIFSERMRELEEGKRLTLQHATSFAQAAEYLPKELQGAAYALYGFCRATDEIVDRNGEVEAKREELGAWKSLLHDAWAGKASANPLIHAFVQTNRIHSIPQALGFELIEGLEKDLEPHAYTDFATLYDYCYAAGGIPGQLMSYVVGAPQEKRDAAAPLGVGMQLTNILRDVKEDCVMGRVYVPKDELERFGVTYTQIENERVNENFVKLMQFQITRARGYYATARPALGYINPDARLSMRVAAAFYEEILAEIERKNYDVFSSRVFVSDSRKKELVRIEMERLAVE